MSLADVPFNLKGVARPTSASLAGMGCEVGRRISDRTERAPLHRADMVVKLIDWPSPSAIIASLTLTIMAFEAFHKDVNLALLANPKGMRTNMLWGFQDKFPTCCAVFVTTQMRRRVHVSFATLIAVLV